MTKNTTNFRYNTAGTWYKGNTHLHTTASDGGKTYEELAALYASAGYDFIAYTDHWVSSQCNMLNLSTPLLLLDGIELDGYDHLGSYYHVVCLGKTMGLERDDGFEHALLSARDQGALLILAHPHWCGNSLEEAKRWHFDGVEVYNHVCHFLNGKSSGAVHWDAMLKDNPGTLGFGVDDTHLRPEHPTWNGGWIMVNSDSLTQESVLDNIRKGNFYSSRGPCIKHLDFDGQKLHITTSPVRYMRLAGPGSRGARIWASDDALLTSGSLEVPDDWAYVYLEVEDANGRVAWTNPLFE